LFQELSGLDLDYVDLPVLILPRLIFFLEQSIDLRLGYNSVVDHLPGMGSITSITKRERKEKEEKIGHFRFSLGFGRVI
jgi:hypothetical protein